MINELKKKYLTPEMKKIKLNNQVNLLQESNYRGPLSEFDSSSDKPDMA